MSAQGAGRIATGVAALLATIDCRFELSDAEREALRSLPWSERTAGPAEEIIADRSVPRSSCLLMHGYAARCLWTVGGERQIVSVHIGGDFVDIHGFFLRVMDHSVVALTDCTVLFIAHPELERLFSSHPRLERVLASLVAIDAAAQRNWMLAMGRKSARARLANFLCELYLRKSIVGESQGLWFSFPLPQSTLADLLGLSVVHTNRSLQWLRGERLVSWDKGSVALKDWERLRTIAQFDPIYLNLKPSALGELLSFS